MQVIEGAKMLLEALALSGKQAADTEYHCEDIISGQAYVALDEGDLLAYAAVAKSPEKPMKQFMMATGRK